MIHRLALCGLLYEISDNSCVIYSTVFFLFLLSIFTGLNQGVSGPLKGWPLTTVSFMFKLLFLLFADKF